jgi:hypothetical protein
MNDDETNLERLIHGKLKQLPPPRAPRTLMPRVLAEVRRRAAQPWYQRAWFTWPRHWQLLSATAAGLVWLLPETGVGPVASGVTERVAGATEDMGVGLNTTLLLWRTLVQPVVWYALAFAGLMVAACAAFGTALGRVIGREMKFA